MKTKLKDRTIICPRCNIRRCRKDGDGNFILCKECEQDFRNKRSKRNQVFVENRIEMYLKRAGFPSRCHSAEMKDLQMKPDHRASMFFIGNKGIGKTYMMTALAKELLRNGESVTYSTVPELILELKKTFKGEGQESEVIDKYVNVPYLFLDDIGVEKPSEWVLQTLFLLIDRRYMDGKHICVSSNLSLNELSLKEDSRIVSRLCGMCEIYELEGKDRRL